MRVKAEVERGKGLVSTFLRDPLIEIWIGVFISIIAFYLVLGCPFRVVVLSSLSLSRKFEAKFPKFFGTTEVFNHGLPGLNGFGTGTH
jgi:hypothetical protein